MTRKNPDLSPFYYWIKFSKQFSLTFGHQIQIIGNPRFIRSIENLRVPGIYGLSKGIKKAVSQSENDLFPPILEKYPSKRIHSKNSYKNLLELLMPCALQLACNEHRGAHLHVHTRSLILKKGAAFAAMHVASVACASHTMI